MHSIINICQIEGEKIYNFFFGTISRMMIYGNFDKRTVERPLNSMNVVPVLADCIINSPLKVLDGNGSAS